VQKPYNTLEENKDLKPHSAPSNLRGMQVSADYVESISQDATFIYRINKPDFSQNIEPGGYKVEVDCPTRTVHMKKIAPFVSTEHVWNWDRDDYIRVPIRDIKTILNSSSPFQTMGVTIKRVNDLILIEIYEKQKIYLKEQSVLSATQHMRRGFDLWASYLHASPVRFVCKERKTAALMMIDGTYK